MSNPYTPALLQELISYDQAKGQLYWRQRTEDVYKDHIPGLTSCDAQRRATHFNRIWAGSAVGTDSNGNVKRVRLSLGEGSPVKRYNVMAIVWAIATGEWPEHEMLARDGNSDNLKPDNIVHCTRSVACIFANPMSGITEYDTIEGKKYKWTVATTGQEVLASGVRCDTPEIARAERDQALFSLGKWQATQLAKILGA